MSPEEQNIEIAKACGWKSFPYCIINGIRKEVETWLSKEELEIGFTCDNMPSGTFCGRGVPSYVNNLNAMHEAEKVLNQKQYEDYCGELYFSKWIYEKHSNWNCDFPSCISSPASARAKSFLRAIGKWTE